MLDRVQAPARPIEVFTTVTASRSPPARREDRRSSARSRWRSVVAPVVTPRRDESGGLLDKRHLRGPRPRRADRDAPPNAAPLAGEEAGPIASRRRLGGRAAHCFSRGLPRSVGVTQGHARAPEGLLSGLQVRRSTHSKR